MACRILVLWPRTELMPSATEARILSHWTTRGVPYWLLSISALTLGNRPIEYFTDAQGEVREVNWFAKVTQPMGGQGRIKASTIQLKNPLSSSIEPHSAKLPRLGLIHMLQRDHLYTRAKASVTCWWARPQRQRPLGTGQRPCPPHTLRQSSWALQCGREEGGHPVVRTLPGARDVTAGPREPCTTHTHYLAAEITHVFRIKFKCLVRSSRVLCDPASAPLWSPGHPSGLNPMSPPQGSLL